MTEITMTAVLLATLPALVAGVTTYYAGQSSKMYEERREKRILAASIRAEVQVFAEAVSGAHMDSLIERLLAIARGDDKNPIPVDPVSKSATEDMFPVFTAARDRIGLLGPEVATETMTWYTHAIRYHSFVASLTHSPEIRQFLEKGGEKAVGFLESERRVLEVLRRDASSVERNLAVVSRG